MHCHTAEGSVDAKVNIEAYDKNRKALYEGLTELGFECVKPEGAFYLFVKSPLLKPSVSTDTGRSLISLGS